jgi:hypothetical protein
MIFFIPILRSRGVKISPGRVRVPTPYHTTCLNWVFYVGGAERGGGGGTLYSFVIAEKWAHYNRGARLNNSTREWMFMGLFDSCLLGNLHNTCILVIFFLCTHKSGALSYSIGCLQYQTLGWGGLHKRSREYIPTGIVLSLLAWAKLSAVMYG